MQLSRSVFFIVTMLTWYGSAFAQEELRPRPSPTAIVSTKYKDTYIKITYSQPHKKGREIFGELVPYGKIWRTGANEATEITLTDNVLINGDTLYAGTYSLFTIPYKEVWTIIFNNELGQWGAYNYYEDADELRTEVPTENIEGTAVWEPFTIKLWQNNKGAEMIMMWDRTRVTVPLEFAN